MRIISALPSPHQDDVIEKVLRHQGQWHPPWQIERKARPRALFLWDRSLYGDLCRSAYASTKKFFEAQFIRLQNPLPAMVVTPQSHG